MRAPLGIILALTAVVVMFILMMNLKDHTIDMLWQNHPTAGELTAAGGKIMVGSADSTLFSNDYVLILIQPEGTIFECRASRKWRCEQIG